MVKYLWLLTLVPAFLGAMEEEKRETPNAVVERLLGACVQRMLFQPASTDDHASASSDAAIAQYLSVVTLDEEGAPTDWETFVLQHQGAKRAVILDGQTFTVQNLLLFGRLTQLQYLRICHAPALSDAVLHELAAGLPLLDSLVLDDCPTLTAQGLSVLFYKYHTFKTLGLRRVQLTEQLYRDIGFKCVNLEQLFIQTEQELGDALQYLAMIRNLKLACFEGVFLNDQNMSLICTAWRYLEELVCNRCKGLTSLGLSNLSRKPGLQALTVTGVNAVNDEFLHMLSRCCQQLHTLKFIDCPHITADGLRALKKLTKLTYLDVRGSTALLDQETLEELKANNSYLKIITADFQEEE